MQFVKSLLVDKDILYLTVFAAVLNVMFYLYLQEFNAVIFFAAIAFITSYFSRNMIVILGSAMATTFFAVSLKIIGRVREGMKGMKDQKTTTVTPTTTTTTMPTTMPTTKGKKGKGNKKQGFEDQLSPRSVNDPDDDLRESDKTEGIAGHKPKINYASTLESAYDNLDKLLSSSAIKNMSSDTQRLASKQQKLLGNINKLEPMMQKAGSLLENLNVDGIADKIASFQGLMDKFAGSTAGGGDAAPAAPPKK